MQLHHHWITAAVIACGTWGPAAAQAAPIVGEQPAASSTPAAAQEALASAEDVALLKALDLLHLTRTQSSELLPALEGAQAKLSEHEAKEAAKLAAWQGPLDQARRDLLAGKGSGSRAGEQFGMAQWTASQNRASLRADLVSSLRATLEKILTPDQAEQMAASGQAALLAQRMAGWRGGGGPGGWGGPGGGPGGGFRGGRGGPGGPGGNTGGPASDTGGPVGGRGGGPSGQLDRIRQMSPADFQQFSQRIAGRMGGETSPQFQQYVQSMNQVRDMPQSQYLLQRDQLAAQGLGRGGFGGAPAGTTDEATRAFVDRYFLSPRAPIVVRDRLQSQ